jgi:hypothetical protein
MRFDGSCRSINTKTHLVCRFCIPASRDAIPHVERRIDEFLTPFLCHKTFTAACEEGASIHTLDFLLERVAPVWKEAVRGATRGGHMHVFRWMTERQDGRVPWKDDFAEVLEIAAAHGHLELVQWLCTRGIDYHTLADIDECSAGYTEKSWLYEHCLPDALEAAAEHGQLEVVQWIHDIGTMGTDACMAYATPMDWAVVYGHLAVAQWLYTNTRPERCCINSIDKAAKNGHLNLL